MTIAQAERFYEQDSKKYDIKEYKELLTWLKDAIKNGYHLFIDIESLQELIDNIVYWYEMKYPERELEFFEGIRDINFENIKNLSKVMDINQLMYRLPHEQLCLMECDYRATYGGIRIDRKNVEYNLLSMCSKSPYFLLYADANSGKVDIDHNLENYVDTDNITLDELLILFKEKYYDELDFTKLEECIYDHNCDIELRRRILQLVALKLLYSNKTIPERGYERAKRFINEFNKKMELNLSSFEIDELINKNYNNLEDRKKYSYWTMKKEPRTLDKAKSLVKTLFKKS